MAAAPLAVVGPRFCAARALPLTLAMNLTRSGTVTDAGGAVVLRVDVPLLRFLHRFLLVDVAGRPLLAVQRKESLQSAWEAFRGDSSDARDLLFTARRSPAFLMRTQMGVFLAPNTARQACDFKMKCSYDDRSCDVHLGNSNTKIAQMRRQISAAGVLLGKDRFSVTVFPNVDYVFVAALVVMLHEIHTDERDR
ncbi:protein LURP-one-related 15-like [Panicum miliaceum]|uniref:Protein LURP-one-related 15-like n=1 Tax=Panicum miliaceum TaxID=4540 RepID=A0A3L6QP95_PANMI|nr:protein LURP-one-related 15-like [Panicum miliaceum]